MATFSELFRRAWRTVFSSPKVFFMNVLASCIPFGLTLFFEVLSKNIMDKDNLPKFKNILLNLHPDIFTISVCLLWGVIIFLVFVYISYFIASFQSGIFQKKHIKFSLILLDFRSIFQYLKLQLIICLGFICIGLTVVWGLFIYPVFFIATIFLSIYLGMRFFFIQPSFFLGKNSPVEALRESTRMTKNRFLWIFKRMFIFGACFGVVQFAIGILIVVPVFFFTNNHLVTSVLLAVSIVLGIILKWWQFILTLPFCFALYEDYKNHPVKIEPVTE